MDDKPQFKSAFDAETGPEELDSSTNQYTSAFFPMAKHFVVAGGTFNSITHIHQAASTAPPGNQGAHSLLSDTYPRWADFPVIPLGHINLHHKIEREGRSGVARRKYARNSVRTVYSARIHGCKSNMTVALYQGNGAEDKWRQDISRYSDLRHPYLAQLYGIVKRTNLHAVVFHDDLIPASELLEKYRDSHFTTVFLLASMNADFSDVISVLSGRTMHWVECTMWIRPFAGHLCIDLTPPETNPLALGSVGDIPRPSRTSMFKPPSASETITSMSLRDYHQICYWHLGQWYHWSVSTKVPMRLGSIRHLSGPEYGSSLEVASSDCSIDDSGWMMRDPIIENHLLPINCDEKGTSIMPNGWIRIYSADVMNAYHRRIYSTDTSSWLAQANAIFNRLKITWDLENFVSVDGIECYIQLSGLADDLPPGYLFLSPLAELETDASATLRTLDRPAYWSLDPSGLGRLRDEAADDLGFPAIHVEMDVLGKSWDASVYDGIRQFQECKGFDPYSQEVTVELGYPHFQVSGDQHTTLAHLRQPDNHDCCSDSDEISYTEALSESGHEQYDLPSERGDAITIQNAQINLRSCTKIEDHTLEDIAAANAGHSAVPEISGVYTEQRVHLSFPLTIFAVPSGSQCCSGEEVELPATSSFNIVITAQLVLILTATALSLYDSF